ncbi:MAG: helix-turn-helix transcriptional regulator [Sediminibacterium sp.]|nr:helix-turn-helix transcriptional regulator [Sediminibacterium sp.]
MVNIGSNIKRIREFKNLSRSFIADNIGVSLKTYSNIENDVSSPDIRTLERIAESMQVSLFRLFNFDDNVILNNNGSHVETFANHITHHGSSEKERALYELLLKEKDERIRMLEQQLNRELKG